MVYQKSKCKQTADWIKKAAELFFKSKQSADHSKSKQFAEFTKSKQSADFALCK